MLQLKEQETRPLLRYDVFGEPVCKEGNCYYFISSLRKVFMSGCLEPWEYQRSLDKDRVVEMTGQFKNEVAKTGNIKLRGSVILCLLKKNYFIQNHYRSFQLCWFFS